MSIIHLENNSHWRLKSTFNTEENGISWFYFRNLINRSRWIIQWFSGVKTRIDIFGRRKGCSWLLPSSPLRGWTGRKLAVISCPLWAIHIRYRIIIEPEEHLLSTLLVGHDILWITSERRLTSFCHNCQHTMFWDISIFTESSYGCI